MSTDTLDQPTPPEPGGGNYNVFNDLSTYIPPVEPRLTADEINAGARHEIAARLHDLTAYARSLKPSDYGPQRFLWNIVHRDIDRLLDDLRKTITDVGLAATQPRSAVSMTWEDFND